MGRTATNSEGKISGNRQTESLENTYDAKNKARPKTDIDNFENGIFYGMPGFDTVACYIEHVEIFKRKETTMNKGLQVIESKENLAELIKNTSADEQILVLCTKPEPIEKTINSYVLASAKIDSNTDMKDFSNQNWTDVVNAMKDLAHRNILMANLNEQSIKTILSKLKSNNVKLKTVLTDDLEKLKASANYAELELFLCNSGASMTSFSK